MANEVLPMHSIAGVAALLVDLNSGHVTWCRAAFFALDAIADKNDLLRMLSTIPFDFEFIFLGLFFGKGNGCLFKLFSATR